MKISLFASSIRHHLWVEMLESLLYNSVEYEVVLAGNLTEFQTRWYLKNYLNLRYIHTGNIKPAQCYEVARRNCTGDLVMWIADDCEFSDGLLDDICLLFEQNAYSKTVLSVKTNEDDKNNNLNDHRFFGGNVNTPLMAPLGVMYRRYLDELGGLDRRYICGQYENDIVMRVLADGGNVVKFEDGFVKIDHLIKHGKGTKFWTGYEHDRTILENSWVIGGYQPPPKALVIYNPYPEPDRPKIVKYYPVTNREVVLKRFDMFEPFEDDNILTETQGPKGLW